MKEFLLLISLLFSCYGFSQSVLHGVVQDEKGEAVFAANVYLKSSVETGVISDFDGLFALQVNDMNDTLVVSFIGYNSQEILLSTINLEEKIQLTLKEDAQTLQQVVIISQDPISEQFSVAKMEKLDIYLNPVSQGDPLKAITTLAASTTTNETANPSLRGSSADRSRVVLNGVPIYNPVRASQLNNQGFFSVFNPEIIKSQYVYASNPPLTYGNTSAGLVEIQTIKKLRSNQLQVSASLASTGVFLSQQIKKDRAFVQVYGNYQFSDAFVGLQKDKLPAIRNFNTQDAGINFHAKIGESATVNSYSYFIDESFQGVGEQFTFAGDIQSGKKRVFTVNNFKYHRPKSVLSLNSGFNRSAQNFGFGNLYSEQKTSQVYSSMDYKWYAMENTSLQFGLSHDYHENSFRDSVPLYYYALSPDSPGFFEETSMTNHVLEAYFYGNWDINEQLSISSGMRSNLSIQQQRNYFSGQLGLKYKMDKKQSFLLSGGKYHNYTVPSFYGKKYNLLSSFQAALDYTFEEESTILKGAVYVKNEKGEQPLNSFFITEEVNTVGLELFVEHSFHEYFKFTFANSFINQIRTINGVGYNGEKDFDYLIKTTHQYSNPNLFSLALTYTGRPGIHYNEINASTFNAETAFYEPIFSNELYSGQYGDYNRLDVSLSRYTRVQNSALIAFVSMNNIFNTENQREVLYNSDYSKKHFDFYQLRTLYFGLMWQFDY